MRTLRHKLLGPEETPPSSAGTGSPSSPPDKGQESPPERQTPATSEVKTADDAINAALGPVASDADAAAATEGKPVAEKPGAKPADDAEAARVAEEDKKAAAGDKDAIAAKKARDDAAKIAADKKAAEDEQARIAEEDRKAAAGDKDAIAAKAKREEAAKDPEEEAEPQDPYAAPKGLKERSNKRWEKLAGMARDANARADGYEKLFKATGASPQAIAGALRTLRLLSSGDPDDLRAAMKIIDTEREGLAKRLGIEVEGVDLLKDFPDLQQAVDGMKMGREQALEIANGRRLKQRTDDEAKARLASEESQRVEQKAVKDAQQAITDWGNEIASKDLDYDAKIGYLHENGTFEWVCTNFPPAKWLEVMQHQYRLLAGAQLKTKPAAPGAKPAGDTPLRPTGGNGGGGKTAPKSDLEAVEAALGA